MIGPEHTFGQVLPALDTLAQLVVTAVRTLVIQYHMSVFFFPLGIISYITFLDLKRIIYAFITSRQDYCNAVDVSYQRVACHTIGYGKVGVSVPQKMYF